MNDARAGKAYASDQVLQLKVWDYGRLGAMGTGLAMHRFFGYGLQLTSSQNDVISDEREHHQDRPRWTTQHIRSAP